MKNKSKILLYSLLLIVSLLGFILQVFIFESPDGTIGMILCMLSVALIFGSLVKLCKLSKRFSNTLIASLDILFWLP